MDFITSLTKYEEKSVIMVVVDQITKYAHLCSIFYLFKARFVAEAFMDTIQKLHGIPNIIVSERDLIFTRNFCTEIFSCLGT